MELVKYVPYLDSDQCQHQHFVYEINPNIQDQVWMWKPTLVSEAIKYAYYTEQMLGGIPFRSYNTQELGIIVRAPQSYLMGGYVRTPPYRRRSIHRVAAVNLLVENSTLSQYTTKTHQSSRNYEVPVGRGRIYRGRIPSQRSKWFISPPPSSVSCWGCGIPHYKNYRLSYDLIQHIQSERPQ